MYYILVIFITSTKLKYLMKGKGASQPPPPAVQAKSKWNVKDWAKNGISEE
jgi:hypothetical protein